MESENPRKRKHSDVVAAPPLGMLVEAEAVRDYQLNDSGPSAGGNQVGNIYSGLTLGGQTRAILGNVFYTTHNNVTNSSEHTAEEEGHEKLMKDLAFDRMDFRRATIDPAHTRTCQWIFEEEAFLCWRNPAFRDKNHGFLWIKGKPGSGKSTLMKVILNHMTSHAPECTTVSFFFNARGEGLERSTEGCYRSLLHQMLQQVPRLHSSIQIPHSLSKGQASPIAMLQNIFHEAVLSLQQEQMVVIIDALDECDQNEVRSMVQFLGNLAEATEFQGLKFHTCFASRHYPSITVRFCEGLVVEQSKGHAQDILIYARDRLAIESDAQRKEVLVQVMQKADEVFMWVVLVVRILNEHFDKGGSHSQLLKAISDLPDDLDALIGSIISGGGSDPELLPTLILILSGDFLMSNNLLFAGIKLIAGKAAHLQDAQSVDLPVLKRFIVNASKGLVEWVDQSRWPDDTHQFQFIHESVRQHILAGGLQKLKASLATNVEANCAQFLADFFGAHIRRPFSNDTAFLERTQIVNQYNGAHGAWLPIEIEFLRYAKFDIFSQLRRAYVGKACDVESLEDFPLHEFIWCGNVLSPHSPKMPSASLLYVLLEDSYLAGDHDVDASDLVLDMLEHCSRCPNTIQNGHTSMICSDFMIGDDLNAFQGGQCGTALITAIFLDNEDVVEQLLDAGANVNVCSGGKGPSSCREKDDRSPLSAAVQSGNVSLIYLLLDRGANVDIRSIKHGSPLGTAAYESSTEIVELLLAKGADVNLEDSEGCNIALKEAVSRRNNLEIVEMLVRAGAHAKAGSTDHFEFITPYRFY